MTDKTHVTIDKTALPANWTVATLADITEYIQRGKSPKYSDHSDLPVINQKCIRWFRIDKEHLKYVHPDQWEKWAPQRYVQEGDILWNSTGTGTIGRAAVIKHLAPGEKYVVDSHVTIVRPKEVEPLYIHYWIMSQAVQGSIEAMQSGSTNQVELSKTAVEALPIPVAPLEQQKRIVAEIEKQFSRLDEAVANLKRVKANLKRYKAAVLKAAVEGRLVETDAERASLEGRDYEPGAQLLQRILETRRKQWKGKGKYKEPAAPDTVGLQELPEGWVWVTLDQLSGDSLIGLDRGRSQQNSDGIGLPYVKMNNVTMDGDVIAEGMVYVGASNEEKHRFSLSRDDLLFNTRNSKELVGKIGLVRSLPNGAIYNNNLMRIRLVEGAKPVFICFQMCSVGFRRRMELVKKATTNVAAVYAKDLFPLQIALSPFEEQNRIGTEVDRLFSVVCELQDQVEVNIKRADRLRQSVLTMAFSGQLIVGNIAS